MLQVVLHLCWLNPQFPAVAQPVMPNDNRARHNEHGHLGSSFWRPMHEWEETVEMRGRATDSQLAKRKNT
jgi:hypothetical protein